MTSTSTIFQNLTASEVAAEFKSCGIHFLKVGKFQSEAEGVQYAKSIVKRFSNRGYEIKFSEILNSINKNGIALTESFQYSLYKEMKVQLSVWMGFKNLNHQKDPATIAMRMALRNAKGIFHMMPSNSKLTFSANQL